MVRFLLTELLLLEKGQIDLAGDLEEGDFSQETRNLRSRLDLG